MALALVDDVTGQAVTILAADESRVVLAWMHAGLDAARRDQRNPSLRFDERAQDAADALTRTTVRRRMSASGHESPEATRGLAASGPASPAVGQSTDMIGTVQVARLLKISRRHAQRMAERVGVKVGGRWLVSRASVQSLAVELGIDIGNVEA